MRTIVLSIKCSEYIPAFLVENDPSIRRRERHPQGAKIKTLFPPHVNDHVILRIDIETGKIVDWQPPADEKLKEIFEENPVDFSVLFKSENPTE